MNVSNIDNNVFELFSMSYYIARDVFGVEPVEASAKKQRKIRKWIDKIYFDNNTDLKNAAEYVSKDVGDAQFLEFLKVCADATKEKDEAKQREFEKTSADFSEEVQSALSALFEFGSNRENIKRVGSDVFIQLEHFPAYDRILKLHNASMLPENEIEYILFENGTIAKRDGKYVLLAEAVSLESDETLSFPISFEQASVEIKTYNALSKSFDSSPWNFLQRVAASIADKLFLPYPPFNEIEKKNLGLIGEIAKTYWPVPDELNTPDFSHLKAYAQKYGYGKVLSLLEKLEKVYFDSKKQEALIRKLISELNKQKYEALWREIFGIIKETQASYPLKTEICYDREKLTHTRSEIQTLLEAHGYSGAYPDFAKRGTVRGIHLEDSYNTTYFIGKEKNAVYHIHCTEQFADGNFTVEFLCGTELLKSNETSGDIYSCLFDAKGRRLFSTVEYKTNCVISEDGETGADNLEQRVRIAVKKAELQRLSREERKEYGAFSVSFLSIFLQVFFIMGGAFAVLMTLSFMLISVILTALFGFALDIPEMLREMPWWQMFAASWILFGGAMGAITAYAKRK